MKGISRNMNNFRLRTPTKIENMLIELQKGLNLSTKAAVMRIAIGITLNQKFNKLYLEDYQSDLTFSEYSQNDYFRYTIFPSDEILYKVLIQQHMSKKISDHEFFPNIVNLYICKGVEILYSNFKLYKSQKTIELLLKGEVKHDIS